MHLQSLNCFDIGKMHKMSTFYASEQIHNSESDTCMNITLKYICIYNYIYIYIYIYIVNRLFIVFVTRFEFPYTDLSFYVHRVDVLFYSQFFHN